MQFITQHQHQEIYIGITVNRLYSAFTFNKPTFMYVDMCVCVHACLCAQSSLTLECNQLGSSDWNFPGKNTGVGCHFLYQEIILTQRQNPRLLDLLYGQADSLPLRHLGIPYVCMCVCVCVWCVLCSFILCKGLSSCYNDQDTEQFYHCKRILSSTPHYTPHLINCPYPLVPMFVFYDFITLKIYKIVQYPTF